jgi:hypothetical protein
LGGALALARGAARLLFGRGARLLPPATASRSSRVSRTWWARSLFSSSFTHPFEGELEDRDAHLRGKGRGRVWSTAAAQDAGDRRREGSELDDLALSQSCVGGDDRLARPGEGPRLVEQGREGYVGDGSNRWNAVHRLDAARLFRLAIEKAPAGAVLHAVGEEGITARKIAELIGTKLGLLVSAIARAAAAGHFGWVGRFFAIDQPASSAQTRQRTGLDADAPGAARGPRGGPRLPLRDRPGYGGGAVQTAVPSTSAQEPQPFAAQSKNCRPPPTQNTALSLTHSSTQPALGAGATHAFALQTSPSRAQSVAEMIRSWRQSFTFRVPSQPGGVPPSRVPVQDPKLQIGWPPSSRTHDSPRAPHGITDHTFPPGAGASHRIASPARGPATPATRPAWGAQ